MKKELTLKEVRQRIEKAFAPDLSFSWDKKGKVYWLNGVSDLGKAWTKRLSGLKGSKGTWIAPYLLERTLQAAGRLSLTCEVEDNGE